MFQRNLLLSNFRVEDGDGMSVTIYQITQHYNPENSHLKT